MTKALDEIIDINKKYQDELDFLKENFEKFQKEVSKCKDYHEKYTIVNGYLDKFRDKAIKFFDELNELWRKYDDITFREVIDTISKGYRLVSCRISKAVTSYMK